MCPRQGLALADPAISDGKKIIAPGTVIVTSGAEVSDVKKTVSPDGERQELVALLHRLQLRRAAPRGSAFAQTLAGGSDVPT
jgi:phosphoribosylformylglycinamidine synthase